MDIEIVVAISTVLSAITVPLLMYITFNITRRDSKSRQRKEDQEKIIESHKKDLQKVENSMKAQIESLEEDIESHAKRLRILEGQQITEDKVKTLLKEKIEPLERAVAKLEVDLKDNYKDLTTEMKVASSTFSEELRKHNTYMAEALRDLSVSLNYLKGRFEAKDNGIRD